MSQATEVRTFEKEAVSLLRSGLAMKKAVLELSLKRYQQRLQSFEQQHSMDSDKFVERFGSGELGDDADWFEWEYIIDACRQARQNLQVLEKIEL